MKTYVSDIILQDDRDVIVESCSEEEDELNMSSGSGAGAAGDENFQQLRKHREQLKKQMEEKQRHEEKVEAVLQR